MSLVDNTQETFGLAVAEAMAAGLPVVASNWNGYRDLVRHGVDGYLVPSRWASTAPAVSARLGWQQFSGIESFPVVAGALAQLVQLDADAAEKAFFPSWQPFAASADGSICFGSSERTVCRGCGDGSIRGVVCRA